MNKTYFMVLKKTYEIKIFNNFYKYHFIIIFAD